MRRLEQPCHGELQAFVEVAQARLCLFGQRHVAGQFLASQRSAKSPAAKARDDAARACTVCYSRGATANEARAMLGVESLSRQRIGSGLELLGSEWRDRGLGRADRIKAIQ